MTDSARREALVVRLRALRERATAFNDRLTDSRAKEFMRTSVFHNLDDVDSFFLGDVKSRPAEQMWESMWLDNAEMVLSWAEQNFAKFEKQVEQYGGPENVRMFG
jgi:hypothetical protein